MQELRRVRSGNMSERVRKEGRRVGEEAESNLVFFFFLNEGSHGDDA
jgi:hypothetical protein